MWAKDNIKDAVIRFCLLQISLLLPLTNAHAVPAYERQTGEKCVACHVTFPELTPFGRTFKLTGYTISNNSKALPLSALLQASMTKTKTVDQENFNFQRDGGLALQQASLFYAGKVANNLGAFTQWTYDGLAHHSQIDMVDIRYASRFTAKDVETIYGLTLHNSPTAQDVWNTTPVFGYPYASSSVAVTPAASTLIDGGLDQQVAGLGGYVFWNKTLYGEISFYRTADQFFSVLRAGTDRTADAALKGYNPYWRLALNHEWGANSVMVGTYGMITRVYPDNTEPSGPTNRYTDIALDTQYQYITDPHTFTAQLNFVREKTNWNASFDPTGVASAVDNASSTLKTFKAKAMYFYQRKYGATLAYFSTTGDTDNLRFGGGTVVPVTGSFSGSPNTNGYIMELNYLPRDDIKLALQYTAYRKFNGASTNYDGNGRNANDNNTLYLLGWFMF